MSSEIDRVRFRTYQIRANRQLQSVFRCMSFLPTLPNVIFSSNIMLFKYGELRKMVVLQRISTANSIRIYSEFKIKEIKLRRRPAFYNEVIFSLPGKSSRSLTLRAWSLKNFLPFSRDLRGFTDIATPTRLSTFARKDLQPCNMANRTKITNHLVEYI